MLLTTMRLASKDEIIRCLYHTDEKKFIIATRFGLDVFTEENMKIRRLELKVERPNTLITHDALFVRRQMLRKSTPIFFIQEVTADSDGAIRGYSCANGKLEWEIPPGSSFGEIHGHYDSVVQIVRGPVLSVGASPIVLTCGLDGLAFAWNIDLRISTAIFDRFPGDPKGRVPATTIAYIENLNMGDMNMIRAAAVGYADGVICLFDFSDGKLLLTLNKEMASSFNASEVIMDETKLKSVPRWKNSVRGLFWSNVYQAIFASIGDEGVFGYDPACNTPTEPIVHNSMNCAYLKNMGPIPELGVGEEGVAAFVTTDGRVMLMRPTYSAARGEGHFIPICTAFSIYEYPPTSTFIMDMGKPTGRCIAIGCQKTLQIIAFTSMPNVFVHGNSETIRESVGSTTHKINFDVENELVEKNRYLSLIPEPMPNEIRYKLAEKEREIGLKSEGSQEQLERILEQFKDIKTGKVKKVKKIRGVPVPLDDEREGIEQVTANGEKIKIVEEEYEEIVEEEYEEVEVKGTEEEELLNEILDMKYFRKILRKITPEGVCPSDVLNTSLAQIEDSLELLKQISLLFKVKIPHIDVEGMANLTDEQVQALDVASTVMSTAYPTVGIETDTGVSTAESRQTMKVQHLTKDQVAPAPPMGMGMGMNTGMGMPVVAGNGQQYAPGMTGMAVVTADDLDAADNQMAGPTDPNLPPYMNAQKQVPNPYANAYGGNAYGNAPSSNPYENAYGNPNEGTMASIPGMGGPTVASSLPGVYQGTVPGIQKPTSAYGEDAYASIAYEMPKQPQQSQFQLPQFNLPYQTAAPQLVQNYSPAVLSSFDAFDILARIVARAIALFMKRAAIVDTRLLVTFGGREAKDLAVSLGSADEDVSIVKAKFERQRKVIEARQQDEIKSIKDMFEAFKQKFSANLENEKRIVAAKFEILRREYNDSRNRAAKKSADLLLSTMLKFFPRFSVIGGRYVIVPNPPKSYPAFKAYDLLMDKYCSVHPVMTQELNNEILFGIANVQGVIRPSGMARSNDGFKKLYIIAPVPPEYTLRDVMDKMPRALHPHEIAHLLFPLVCTLARLQALPRDEQVVVHRDIRPSTIFLTPKEQSIDDFIKSQYPQYDPNAPTYDNGNVQAKRWPVPPVPTPSIFHLGVIRNMVMDEPIELNSMYCAPEVMLGGVCESSDTWSIGILCIKLLLPQVGGVGVTRMTNVAMPTGPLSPVINGMCTCPTSIAGYLNDVARLSNVIDRVSIPLIDDIAKICKLPPYGYNLLKSSLPIQSTSVSASGNVNTNNFDMNTYSGINSFVQQSTVPNYAPNALNTVLPQCDPGTLQFLRDCLAFNPRERPSPIKLAYHPWFREHGLRVF